MSTYEQNEIKARELAKALREAGISAHKHGDQVQVPVEVAAKLLPADSSQGSGRLVITGQVGEARDFTITSPFVSHGNTMTFTMDAADADVSYRVTIERAA